jgi:hypothetical protein
MGLCNNSITIVELSLNLAIESAVVLKHFNNHPLPKCDNDGYQLEESVENKKVLEKSIYMKVRLHHWLTTTTSSSSSVESSELS